MIAAADLCAKFQQALDEKWGYIWGKSGQTWTQAQQTAATREQTVKWGSKWIGRRVADCSGLFVWAVKELGGSIYHGSNTIWREYCSAQGLITADTQLRPGTAAFLTKNGNRHHIGLYIGGGIVIEAKGTYYGVVKSKLEHWDEWGELNMVTYTGDAPAIVLSIGSRGQTVVDLQNQLNALGYDCGTADGIFGTKTEKAVKALQKDAGLTADGIVGTRTWGALAGEKQADKADETLKERIIAACRSIEDAISAIRAAVAGMGGGSDGGH
jgi:hypothetical protein